MNEQGKHSSKSYTDRFGSWNEAKKAAGLKTREHGVARNPGQDPIPKEDLINELQRLAEELGRTPGTRDMSEKGEYCADVYERRIGWNNALKEAGLEPNMELDWSESELIDHLKDVAEKLGRTPRRNEIRHHSPVSSGPYRRLFDSWNDAVEQAGLEKNSKKNISEEELLSELNRLAEELDRSPKRRDMREFGKYSGGVYWKRFGSWNDALREAGLDIIYLEEVSREELIHEIQEISEELDKVPTQADLLQRTQYSIHWYRKKFESLGEAFREAIPDRYGERLLDLFYHSDLPVGDNWKEQRTKALERDGFQCVRCGLSREEHRQKTGFDLHVHHRKPRKRFYKSPDKDIEDANKLENLITLCSSCHRILECLPVQPKPPDTATAKVS
jgi:predicted HNH restriction endonuclease